ncbi:MAG: hypothetical protein NC350_00955 [Corallococcus sp.]|nr:hypothetical protein [Corallococcus sp.]
MSNFSKLQKELGNIVDKRLGIGFHCVTYRMNSKRGSTNLPRFFVTLGWALGVAF